MAVDDDFLILTNTIAMLEDLGHIGIAASSGKEALDILRREDSVDLVITDQAMPEMTGVQLAEAIKKEWPDLPVILATGYAELERGGGRICRSLQSHSARPSLARSLRVSIRDPPKADAS